MTNAFRPAVFVLIGILLRPCLVFDLVGFMLKLLVRNRPEGISGPLRITASRSIFRKRH